MFNLASFAGESKTGLAGAAIVAIAVGVRVRVCVATMVEVRVGVDKSVAVRVGVRVNVGVAVGAALPESTARCAAVPTVALTKFVKYAMFKCSIVSDCV